MNARKQEVLKVAEQAAAWLVAVEEDDHAQFAALNNWLRESPLHVEMFLRMTAVERLMDAVPADERQKLRKNFEADDNVRHISPILPSLDQRRAVRFSLRRLAMAASLIVTLAVLGWLAVAYVDVDPSERFTTGVGEQRSISLPDGSVLYLNADSQVKVLYSEQERLLHMISGEALFKVQRDPSRPFRVVMDTSPFKHLAHNSIFIAEQRKPRLQSSKAPCECRRVLPIGQANPLLRYPHLNPMQRQENKC